jgi:hypothetical protein
MTISLEEFEDLMNWLADVNPDAALDRIIDTAMCRHSVKKGRRPHVRAVVRTAFELAIERAQGPKPCQFQKGAD